MLEDMRIFATVVDHTSLNKAAERLNISQPALSRRIARLEAKLGIALFRRIGKRLELTPAGQLTYEFSQELRRFHGAFLQKLNAFKEGEDRRNYDRREFDDAANDAAGLDRRHEGEASGFGDQSRHRQIA